MEAGTLSGPKSGILDYFILFRRPDISHFFSVGTLDSIMSHAIALAGRTFVSLVSVGILTWLVMYVKQVRQVRQEKLLQKNTFKKWSDF